MKFSCSRQCPFVSTVLSVTKAEGSLLKSDTDTYTERNRSHGKNAAKGIPGQYR